VSSFFDTSSKYFGSSLSPNCLSNLSPSALYSADVLSTPGESTYTDEIGAVPFTGVFDSSLCSVISLSSDS
jgi:hypothetical protein